MNDNNQPMSYNTLKTLLDVKYVGKNASWVFRGQPESRGGTELRTSLERECDKSGIDPKEAYKIEEMMIREFRRVYDGADRKDVVDDTLYCLSLLRHHGAPTRLLDFTYSKYVALYNGLQAAYNSLDTQEEPVRFAVWCIDSKYMNERAEIVYWKDLGFRWAFGARAHISERNDKSFRPLYMDNKYDLVISENPARIHGRLHLQQGVLLCPGNVKKSFKANLCRLPGSLSHPSPQSLSHPVQGC